MIAALAWGLALDLAVLVLERDCVMGLVISIRKVNINNTGVSTHTKIEEQEVRAVFASIVASRYEEI